MAFFMNMVEKAPQDFLDKLAAEFPDLRIRWSEATSRWRLEQRVGRAAFETLSEDPFDDNLICARDGFTCVMEIAPGTQTKCPDCGFWLTLSVGKAKEVKCEYCFKRGRDAFHWFYHFPLGEVLLDHLRKTDPRRGMTQILKAKADAINQKLIEAVIRKRNNIVEATMLENFVSLCGIPTVGLSGKTDYWKNAPESKPTYLGS